MHLHALPDSSPPADRRLTPKQVRLLLYCLEDGSLGIRPADDVTPYPVLVLTLETTCFPEESE